MRRSVGSALLLVADAAALAAGGRIPATGAQDATPAAAGTTVEVVAAGESATLPSAPVDIVLLRFRTPPGVVDVVPADDPALGLIYVESGQLTVTLTAPVVVVRAGTLATPGAGEPVAAGTQVVLGPGDSFVGPPNSGGEFRNDGAEELGLLVAAVAPQEGGTAEATPAA